jgi:hypothetical protein
MISKLLNLFPANPKHVFPWSALFALLGFASINTLNTPVNPWPWIVLLIICVAGFALSVLRMVKQDSLTK